MVIADKQLTFSDILDRYASQYKSIVVLAADTINRYELAPFTRAHPRRQYNFGCVSRHMVGAASGFALQGKIPFVCMDAASLVGECFSQMKTLISQPHHNVVFLSQGSGFSSGAYGLMHQSFEDIAIMNSLENMQIFTPGDLFEVNACIPLALKHHGPSYIRLPRFSFPVLEKRHEYQPSIFLGEGKDVGIISLGGMSHHCVQALDFLREKSIYGRVLHMASFSDFDYEAVRSIAQDCKLLIVVEDHVNQGALSTRVGDFLCDDYPRDFFSISMDSQCSDSGSYEDLCKKYGFDGPGIARQIRSWWTELGYY